MRSEIKIMIAVAVVVVAAGITLSLTHNPQAVVPSQPVDGSKLVRENSHMTGKKDAKVTLTEFADFQCPACGVAYPVLKQVKDHYAGDDRVNFVYRHFPLDIHPNARPAAEAAEAAGAQGKFWEMHDLLYQKQTEWSGLPDATATFASYAQQLGLNADELKASIEQKRFREVIQADVTDGLGLEINSTPTFFINNDIYRRILTPNEFIEKIDEALAK